MLSQQELGHLDLCWQTFGSYKELPSQVLKILCGQELCTWVSRSFAYPGHAELRVCPKLQARMTEPLFFLLSSLETREKWILDLAFSSQGAPELSQI